MKTLHLDTEPTWRGGEQQMLSLARGLAARGHEAIVLCRPDSPCMERVRAAGLTALPLETRADADPWAARTVARAVRATGAEIVHAHTSRTLLAASMHRCFAGRPARVVAHRRVDFSLHKMPLRLSGLKYRWGVDRYIAITRCVRDVMVRDGIAPERIAVVHSSVDLARFAGMQPRPGLRRELGVPEDAQLVGNAAALVDHKGQVYLIRAAAELVRRAPRAHVLIVGEGPLRPNLEREIAGLGLRDRITLAGFRPDALDCIAAMDVFCLSSWGEGMGSVVLEALALRRPTVAARAGGAVEVIRDGENGLLCPVRDDRALADAITRLLGDSALARRLGEAGRATVERSFSADRMVERTIAVYEDALGRDR